MNAPSRSWVTVLAAETISESELSRLSLSLPDAVWWFLGNSYPDLLTLRQQLPPAWREGDIADRLGHASRTLREDYRNLDQALHLPATDLWWWEASALAERNPNSSDVLLTASRLAVVDSILPEPGPHILIAEPAFARYLYLRLRQFGQPVHWGDVGQSLPGAKRLTQIKNGLRWRMQAAVNSLKPTIRAGQRWWLLRRLRRTQPLPLAELRQANALVVSWTNPKTFAEGVPAQDNLLGCLPAAAAKAGQKIAYLAKPLWWTSPFAETAANTLKGGAPVVFLEDCLRPWDILRGLLESLMLTHRCRRLLRRQTSLLAEAARYELPRQAIRAATLHASLLRAVPAGLKRLGLAPDIIAYPCENHPWEKTLLQGAARHLPDSRLVALMHAPSPGQDVSYLPSRNDLEIGHIPHRLLVLGEHWRQVYLSIGFPPDRLDVVGAVRYVQMPEAPPPPDSGDGWKLLCCTGINLGESIELTVKAAQAIQGRTDLTLTINFHPLVDDRFRAAVQTAVERFGQADPARIVYSRKGVRDLLGESHLVLYENTAAAYDAGWNGRTLVHVGSEVRLDLDTMIEGGAHSVLTAGQLSRLLDSLLVGAYRDKTAQQRQLITRCLGPVREQAFLDCLPKRGVS